MKVLNNFWLLLEKKQKFFFLIIVFFSIIQAILEMIGIAAAIPFVTYLLKPESLNEINFISNYIDINKIAINDQAIIILCIIFFSIFLIKNIVIIFTNKIVYYFIFSLKTRLFTDLLSKILHQDFLFFVKKGMAKIFNITFNEVHVYSVSIVRPLILLITELLVTFGILSLIIITGNIDGLILIFPVMLFVVLILKRLNKSIKDRAIKRIKTNEKIVNSNFNLVNGIKEILLFGKINDILYKFNNSLKTLQIIEIKNNLVTSYPKALLEQAVILIFITIILFMSHYGTPNDNIIIILSFYLAAAYRLVPSINKIFVSYQQIKFGKPSIPKIMEYYNLRRVNRFIDAENKIQNFNFQKKIELKI